MPFVAGTFIRDNSAFTGPLVWTDDRDAGTKITSAHHDYHDQDIANGLSLTFLRDGTVAATGDFNLGSHKITSLGAAASNTDAAQFGQTPDTMALDAGTNILTLTLQNGDTIDVDLSALAVGGSTADFARLSATQTFAGINTFSQAPLCAAGVSIPKTTGNVALWRMTADNIGKFSIIFSGTFTGSALEIITSGNNAALGYICGNEIWTKASLTPAQLATYVTTSSNSTITGAWTFTNPSLKLVPFLWTSAVGGGDWTVGPADASTLLFTDPVGLSPLVYVIDSAPTAGAYLQIGPNAKRVWDQGSLLTLLTAAPSNSDGEDGNAAFVVSGADKGVWVKDSGTWAKIAS